METKIFTIIYNNGEVEILFGEDSEKRGYIAMARYKQSALYYYRESEARRMALVEYAKTFIIFDALEKFFNERTQEAL